MCKSFLEVIHTSGLEFPSCLSATDQYTPSRLLSRSFFIHSKAKGTGVPGSAFAGIRKP